MIIVRSINCDVVMLEVLRLGRQNSYVAVCKHEPCTAAGSVKIQFWNVIDLAHPDTRVSCLTNGDVVFYVVVKPVKNSTMVDNQVIKSNSFC